MIRPTDAFVLAYTKLRTHKVRTGLTVGIAGILFGLMLAMVFIVQGVFDSVARFDKVGLSDRSIVMVADAKFESANAYEYLSDPVFVREVENEHKALVDKKTAAAKKYGIDYNAAQEDPVPVVIDPETKVKVVPEEQLSNPSVVAAAKVRNDAKASKTPFDIHQYLKPYSSATILPDFYPIAASDGSLVYMKDGKEPVLSQDQEAVPESQANQFGAIGLEDSRPAVVNQAVTESFVTNHQFDPATGELPVIVPFSIASKQLGFTPLDKQATTEQRLERLEQVRSRIGEVVVSYCYRNDASSQLLQDAIAQKEEIQRGQKVAGYQKPSLIYEVPANDSCGEVKVASDTRTAAEKQQDANRIAYQKEIGVYPGEPEQHKLTFRGVGITSDPFMGDSIGLGDMVIGLLGSNLGYGTLAVPADLLAKVPSEFKPAVLFDATRTDRELGGNKIASLHEELYLVEFADKQQARTLLRQSSESMSSGQMTTSATQFGSQSLVVDEIKQGFMKVVLWALAVIGGIALVILGSMIGRTVVEGRRESAVFRAIGAKRSDIAAVYGCYALLLSIRVVVFALVLGLVIALAVEALNAEQMTVGARFAYAASDTTLQFHLFSVMSWYVPLIIGAILLVGLLASIIPIIRSARRNPISDMRDDT